MNLRPIVLFASLQAMLGVAVTGCSPTSDDPKEQEVVVSQEALQDEQQLLWTQHAAWTRTLLVETLADTSSTPQVKVRLRDAHADLGDALRPFFGDEAAVALTDLLAAESGALIDVLDARRSGDADAAAEAEAHWRARTDELAALFAEQSSAWSGETFARTLELRVDATLEQIDARLAGDWARDWSAFERLQLLQRSLADEITSGLAANFPERISLPTQSPERRAQQQLLRQLWQERAIWTRSYVVSATRGLPDAPYVLERLSRNGDAIASALDGESKLHQATSSVLARQSNGVAQVTTALLANDPVSIDDAAASFHENAYEIAEILALTADAPTTELSGQLQLIAQSTIDQVEARVRGDWSADIAAFDEQETHALRVADRLSSSAP